MNFFIFWIIENKEDTIDGTDQYDGIKPPKLAVKYPKYVNELDQVRQKRYLATMTSDLHIWLVIIVGLFFAIPAIQISYRDVKKSKQSKYGLSL